MSAEPILVTDRVPRMWRACAKIHKAEGRAISLKFDMPPRPHTRPDALPPKTVDGFQRVDESLGISESFAAGRMGNASDFFISVMPETPAA
jgi:hypothetical protein